MFYARDPRALRSKNGSAKRTKGDSKQMKVSGFGHALGCVVAAMLAGCGGSQPPIGAPGAGSATLEKATGGYLYVSNDYEYSVVLFSYDPKSMTANPVGQYGVNAEPVGSCSDAQGNVYVVAYSGYTSVITEFASAP